MASSRRIDPGAPRHPFLSIVFIVAGLMSVLLGASTAGTGCGGSSSAPARSSTAGSSGGTGNDIADAGTSDGGARPGGAADAGSDAGTPDGGTCPAAARGTCNDPSYPMYCGNGRCCPSGYPYYCAATNDCFDSPNGAVAWCDGQCVTCGASVDAGTPDGGTACVAPGAGTCNEASYPLNCGGGTCCPSPYAYYCANTDTCYRLLSDAAADCDGQCVACSGTTPDGGTPDGGSPDGGAPDGGSPDGGAPDGGVACRISPQGSCSDPAYPLTCDEICCSIEYPFYCAATRLCYGTEAGAAAACGAACVACTSATAIDGRDALLGPWTAEGTTDFNFGGAIFVPSRTESGQVTILAGTQADRIVYPWGACGVPGVMTGRDAAVVAGHACTVASGGESWAYTFTSGEFVLSTSSLLLFNAVGDVTYTDTRRVAYPGQFMIQVMLTR